MLRSQNDLILHVGGKLREIIAVSADPHDEIAVRLGILSRLFQKLAIRNVDLHFKAASLHIDLDQAFHHVERMGAERAF